MTKEIIIREAAAKRNRAKSIIRTNKLKLSHIGRIRSASDFSIGHGSGHADPTGDEAIYRDTLREEIEEAEMDFHEAQRIIRNQLRAIKDPTVRAIYRCRFVKQMSWRNVAKVLNMEEAAVKMRYGRYRDKEKLKNKQPA